MNQSDYIELLKATLARLDDAERWLRRSYGICSEIGIKENYTDEEYDAFETLTSRFARVGDFLLQKVFRTIDQLELEEAGTLIDTLNRAEKRGLIDAADNFRQVRELRNQIAREAYDQVRAEGRLEGLAERSFYNNIRAYDRYLADLAFDANAFADDVNRIVVEPLEGVRQLFEEKPYLTRLYTTLSADEMTLDPMFSYNPDLPDVNNIRFADAAWDCADPENTPIEEWELIITLADGRQIRTRPFADGGGPRPLPIGEPAAAIVERLDTSGPPQTLRRLTAVAESENGTTPTDWSLLQNYPNPFNSGTVLPFRAPSSTATAALHIYNILGQKVRTLVEGPVLAGYREVIWDGLDQSGQLVASGVYLYRLETDSIELTRKMLFLR